jgi:hypothetical protein
MYVLPPFMWSEYASGLSDFRVAFIFAVRRVPRFLTVVRI